MSKSEINTATARYMASARACDPIATASVYTPDAWYMTPHMETVKGRDALIALFESSIAMGVADLKLTSLELEIFGDTAHEISAYEMFSADGTLIEAGKTVGIWKKIDGQWLIHRDIANSIMAHA